MDAERADRALPGAAARAGAAALGRAEDARVVRERQHLVDPQADVVREIMERAQRGDHGVPTVQLSEPDRAMIDGDDCRREGGAGAIGIAGVANEPCGRARRGGRAGSRRPVGQQLRVTLVEADQSIAQMVGREALGPDDEAVPVDLVQEDILPLERRHVDLAVGAPAHERPLAREVEPIAEVAERLEPDPRLLRAQQRAQRREQAVAAVYGAPRVIHPFPEAGEQILECCHVARGQGGVETGLHGAAGGGRQTTAGRARRRGLGRERGEACQRVGFAVGFP